MAARARGGQVQWLNSDGTTLDSCGGMHLAMANAKAILMAISFRFIPVLLLCLLFKLLCLLFLCSGLIRTFNRLKCN